MSCSGPRKVVDFTVISSLVGIHKKQHAQYKDVKNKEAVNLGLQKIVTKQAKENTEIREKIRKRITNTQLLLTELGKLPECIRLIGDIHDYQSEFLDMAKDRPELSLIALQTEILLVKRVNRLYNYVYLNALVGTDLNKMPIAKRLEIIDYVIKELRVMRGFCYSIIRKMRSAKYGNTISKLLEEFKISKMGLEDINRMEIINDIMPN